jgi:hypothetical protein
VTSTYGVAQQWAAPFFWEFVMSRILRFSLRRVDTILICRERNGGGWLTLCGSHGWLFGSLSAARREAKWLALNLSLPVRELCP